MNELTYREASMADLPFLDALIEADEVAAARDIAPPDNHGQQQEAMRAIEADPNHELWIVELDGTPVASFQLSYLPGVSRKGAWRGQIESVRVTPELRGKGVGAAMMRWAIARCEERGCGVVQLTSDVNRPDAHRFYERLGFSATHAGFKLRL
ncbi:GNAT family N-acetyltransferase [Aurantiacibacter sp. MUD11]|uniref:GNAT family N-acetyltransferase n=1 Tax=Aurantiacibacter sp. MUD11 TaxID=3003265 RepID=UPI0022AA79B8|nr:GNAT family N-acetyltransferase [Aurantiacibacter sp. MUD11]WAT18732.1 GNAT family N-acetyltransferase [Aurantiacibacter sp. MUD11]